MLVAVISFSVSLDSVFADPSRVCCEKTKDDSAYNGDYCVFAEESDCDTNYGVEDVVCEFTDVCKPGCCVDEESGSCEPGVYRRLCSERGGIPYDDEECNIESCQTGCCILSPSNAVFTTQARCAQLVAPYENIDFAEAFDSDITSEIECIQQARAKEKGCCVNPSDNIPGQCEFMTREECDGTSFEPNKLCSSQQACECTEKFETRCVFEEGYEAVYWFDSCGNQENIYGTEYDPSGHLVPKEESCPVSENNNNAESLTCGNCDYSFSSICTEASDDYLRRVRNSNQIPDELKDRINHMCIDTRCLQTEDSPLIPWDGGMKQHGEAWCEYQGAVGDGEDLVGSRHLRHICINGKEIIEPCSSFREEVCVQGEIPEDTPEIGGKLSAVCQANNWLSCLGANGQDNCELNSSDPEYRINTQNCGRDCAVFKDSDYAGEDADENFNECCKSVLCKKQACNAEAIAPTCYFNEYFSMCLPGVPIGGFLDDPDHRVDDYTPQEICDAGDFTCTEYWEKDNYGDTWTCKLNCDCHIRTQGTQSNNLCRSLGDCGAHYNLVGVRTTSGFSRSGGPIYRDSSAWPWADDEQVGHPHGGFGVSSFSSFRNANEPLAGAGTLWAQFLERLVVSVPPEYFNDVEFLDNLRSAILNWGGGGVLVASIAIILVTDMTFGIALGALLQTALFWNGVGAMGGIAAGEAAAVLAAEAAWTAAFDAAILEGATVAAAEAAALEATGSSSAAAAGEAASGAGAASGASAVITTVLIYLAIAIALTLLIMWILSLGHDTAELTYEMDCDPWVAPYGGSYCEECNEYDYCDEYMCQSLGQECKLINEGLLGEEACIWDNPNDLTAPIIKPFIIAPFDQGDVKMFPSGSGTRGYEFKEEIEAYSDIKIGISTFDGDGSEELSLCKISRLPNKPFGSQDEVLDNQMTFFFDGDSDPAFRVNHTRKLFYLSDGLELADGADEIILEPGKKNRFYVKCQNTAGVSNNDDYFIDVTVSDEPDTTPLYIEGYSLMNGARVPAHVNSIDLMLYLNEIASPVNGGCRWSNSAGVSYENMENNFSCLRNQVQGDWYGCAGTLTGIEEGDNAYYFRCSDASGNIHTSAQPEGGYHLFGTNELNISYSSPGGTIYASGATLEVETIGGVGGVGVSTCYYSTSHLFDINGYIFDNTIASSHSHEFPILPEGNHLFYVWCEDYVGNDATTEISFNLQVDRTPPRLLRIWTESGQLKIQVHEEATCEYSNEDSTFNFGNGIAMVSSQAGTVHAASYEAGNVYYIKCRDFWSPPNEMGVTVYP